MSIIRRYVTRSRSSTSTSSRTGREQGGATPTVVIQLPPGTWRLLCPVTTIAAIKQKVCLAHAKFLFIHVDHEVKKRCREGSALLILCIAAHPHLPPTNFLKRRKVGVGMNANARKSLQPAELDLHKVHLETKRWREARQ
ncbi:hypothetical protein E2C01_038415 [Portunus trituberculatus]|uniref:Uncharacterized protein n=1 Tax=Portunus trituberculatus TaxID=210409 RepID=A0A5B7FH68_PORTR|nr:hypothetical protein [Portunus trituberculatus]